MYELFNYVVTLIGYFFFNKPYKITNEYQNTLRQIIKRF